MSVQAALVFCFAGLFCLQSFSQPLATGSGKFLGAGTSNPVSSRFNLYWNQVTPGNDGKWGSVEAVRGQYNWANLDIIYDYAISNSFPFKEHTLIWGNQQPSWIVGLDSAQQRAAIEKWIDTVAQRYPSTSLVDVVNEPFHAPPVYKNALGGDGTTGWDWVITAFQLARQSNFRGVKLILNEYNILHDNSATTNYINLITLLKDRGLIDGIGIQGHYFEFRSEVGATGNVYVYSLSTIQANLERIAQLGLPIYITEFDIDEPIDSNQLAQYKIYFPIFWAHPAVKGMTLWGYIQNDVWNSHPNTYLLFTNGSERPAAQWLRKFTAIPFPPVAISPAGTTGEPSTPRLVWHPAGKAKTYRLQLSANPGFSPLFMDSTLADTTLRADSLQPGTTYYWHVSASNDSGASAYSSSASFSTAGQSAGVDNPGAVPSTFSLSQNYPNPFNPVTQIRYSIGRSGFASLKVYDVMGRVVATLFAGLRQPGRYAVTLDGSTLASGVYLYRLQGEGVSLTRKFVLVK